MSCKTAWQKFVNFLRGRTCLSGSQADSAARCIKCDRPLTRAGECPAGHRQQTMDSDPATLTTALKQALALPRWGEARLGKPQASRVLLQAEVLLNQEGLDPTRGSTARSLAAAVVQQMAAQRAWCRDKQFRLAVSLAASNLGHTMATALARTEHPAIPLVQQAYNVGRLLQTVGQQLADKHLFAQGYVLICQARSSETGQFLPLAEADIEAPPPLKADLALDRDAAADLYEKFQAAQATLRPIQVGLALSRRTRWLGHVAADERADSQLRAGAAAALAADLLHRYPVPQAAPLVQPWLIRAYQLSLDAADLQVRADVEQSLSHFYHIQGNAERQRNAVICWRYFAGQAASQREHWQAALHHFGAAYTALQEAYRHGLEPPTPPVDEADRAAQDWDRDSRQMTEVVQSLGAVVEGIPTEADAATIRECDIASQMAAAHAGLRQYAEARELYQTALEKARRLEDHDLAAAIVEAVATLPPADPPSA